MKPTRRSRMQPASAKMLALAALFAVIVLQGIALAQVAPATPPRKMNVLFIMSDDLRAELKTFDGKALTPHLDALAAKGVRFDRAYCQYPLCCPSRSSMLTGRYPTTTNVYGNRDWVIGMHPDWKSLPQYFKENGYLTLRSGKIFHGGIDHWEAWDQGGEQRRFGDTTDQAGAPGRRGRGPVAALDPDETDGQPTAARRGGRRGARAAAPGGEDAGEVLAAPGRRGGSVVVRRGDGGEGAANPGSDHWAAIQDPADNMGDTRATDRTIEYLNQYGKGDKPFFMAFGLSKPHSPLEAPERFFNLYTTDGIELSPDYAPRPTVPENFPAGSIRPRNADLFIGRDSTPETAKEMRLAYYACVSYVDWNVGRVLDALKEQGLEDNTIVIFQGDHGYQLGEKGKWSKAGSLWEEGARVPYIIYDPRAKGNGTASPRVVQVLDTYPTLADLCDLPEQPELEGVSLRPLLDNPKAEWDKVAYTVWNERNRGITGAVVRDENYRYAEFFGRGPGKMLIDLEADPYEMHNLADDPKYAETATKMGVLLHAYVDGKTDSGQ